MTSYKPRLDGVCRTASCTLQIDLIDAQVQLQRQMEGAARDFAVLKKEREREVLQLRRQVSNASDDVRCHSQNLHMPGALHRCNWNHAMQSHWAWDMQERKTAVQVQKLEAAREKQQAVLRRKTEEAEAARKRLKVTTSHPAAFCWSP